MIKPLRKRHVVVWWLWLLLLPALFVAGITQSPALMKATHKTNQGGSIQNILASNEFAMGRVLVTANAQGKHFVQLQVHEPLPAAFATVHAVFGSEANVAGSTLLGKAGSTGSKTYALASSNVPTHLIIYDYLKQKPLYTINLSN